MPPVALHCLVHLLEPSHQSRRFPAIYAIRHSDPTSSAHYSLFEMMIWASIPYMVWQLSYHAFITVRRREKIAAGRPTSFTWLRRSYAPTWIGKFVLSLPTALQEPAFMCIQYAYALLTMLPCPLWFWSRWASAIFLAVVFVWSIHNGATYYIDVFGKRFQTELEALKRDVARWQGSPDALRGMSLSGFTTPTPGSAAVTPGFASGIDGILGGVLPTTPGATTPAPGAPSGISPFGPAPKSTSPRAAPPSASASALPDISLGAPGMSISSGLGMEGAAERWRGDAGRTQSAAGKEQMSSNGNGNGTVKSSEGMVVGMGVDGWVEGRKESSRSSGIQRERDKERVEEEARAAAGGEKAAGNGDVSAQGLRGRK